MREDRRRTAPGGRLSFLGADSPQVATGGGPGDGLATLPPGLVDAGDIVIVGAGSAGCVLANRLSARADRAVVLLEAGGSDQHPNVRVPLGFAKLFRTSRDWALRSEPEPQLGDRSLYIPRGRMLGGSSSLNAMIYIRGRPRDYDDWAAQGNPGWSHAEVLPYFRRAESNARLGDASHGTTGPLIVQDPRSPNPISSAFVAAAVALGHRANPDFNGADPTGAGLYQLTQRRGRRWSAADAYLTPVRDRPNLHVVTDATVVRVVFERDRAVAVEYLHGGTLHTVRARDQIVLAAGAIGSPTILQRSGVGPAALLRSLGIEVVLDRPAVGANLQDHPVVPLAFASTRAVTLPLAPRLGHVLRWLALRTGPLTSNVAEAGLFVDSGGGLVSPDLQFHVAPVYFVEHGFVAPPGRGFTLGPTLVSPTSRGAVVLASVDPRVPPRIRTGALGDPRELAALRWGLRLGREIAQTEPLRGFVASESLPGDACRSDTALDAHIRRHAELLYHPVGTCKMGPATSDDAVVDAQLRVHGLAGLRVADASIMPTIVGGNTNAPTIMIAERAADVIDRAHPVDA